MKSIRHNFHRQTIFNLINLIFLISFSWAAKARAQLPVYEGAMSVGSGVSYGQGHDSAVVLRSPVYIDLDIIYYNDEHPTLELVVGLLAQIQGNVSAGAIPQVRLTTGPDKKMWYGILGVPIIFAPAVLVGVEAGAGFLYRLNDRFGVFGELVLDVFFLGNDIKGNGVLLQTNFNAGIRIKF